MKNPLWNIAAGVLIGFVNEPWHAVLLASLAWATVASTYLWLAGAYEPLLAALHSAPRPRQFWFGSASASIWVITWVVTFGVSVVVALLTYGIRQIA